MGADMLLRDLYLPIGTTLDLPAAKAAISDLCRQATVADLRILLERTDQPPRPERLQTAGHAHRRAGHRAAETAEQSLHILLSLRWGGSLKLLRAESVTASQPHATVSLADLATGRDRYGVTGDRGVANDDQRVLSDVLVPRPHL